MKIALTGIIKNEAHDILYWLAWHAHLGVDSFILFDDNSSDGTRDLLTMANLYWDIRLYHVRDIAISPQPPGTPGKAALLYQAALGKLQDEFDWAGFLSADDYIELHHHANLRELLASEAETSNWVDLPLLLPSHREENNMGGGSPLYRGEQNSHSRCFLRPEAWQAADAQIMQEKGAFLQQSREGDKESEPPHIWPASPAVPLLSSPDGSPATITKLLAILDNDAASIVAPEIMAGLFPVIRAGMLNTLEELKLTHPLPPRLSPPPIRQTAEHIHISQLHSETGRPIGMRDRLAQTMPEGETAPPLMLLQSQHLPAKGFIFAWGEDNSIQPVGILEDRHAAGLLSYDILPVMGHDAIALRTQASMNAMAAPLFLSCQPTGPLVANRSQADLWEFFTLTPQPHTPAGTSWLEHPIFQFAERLLQEPVSIRSITQLLHIDRDIAIFLLPLLGACLPRHEQLELQGYLGPFAQFSL